MVKTIDTLGHPYTDDYIRQMHLREQEEARKNDESKGERIDDDRKAVMEIDAAISECRSLYRTHLISDRTREEYEKMWSELRSERKVSYMQENIRYLSETISRAKDYEARFKSQLDEAVENKWIGKLSREHWWARFEKSDVLEWDRKKWIKEEFPEYLKGWKETANVRKDVRRLAKKLNVKENQVPELKGVMRIEQFLGMQFGERKNKVYAAKAALLAYEQKQVVFYRSVRNELENAITCGYMHKNKMGPWLAKVMQSDNPKKYYEENLIHFIADWRDASLKFNELSKRMRQGEMPRGFRSLTKDQFLLCSYEQRRSYLSEMKSRMESDVNAPNPLANLTLGIRHNLNIQDWETAEELLWKAKEIDPYDEGVLSMENYLRTHRPKVTEQKEEEAPDPQRVLDDIRMNINQAPGRLKNMNIIAAFMGAETVKALFAGEYNLVWVEEHGYSTDLANKKNADSDLNKEKTRNYIENGHTRKLEHNVLEGDTAHRGAIRDNCTKAQMIHVNDDSACHTVVQEFHEHKDDYKFQYWSTIHTNDISYEQHRLFVRNHGYKIKKGMQELEKLGYRFTLSGTAQKMGAASPAASASQPQTSTPPVPSLAA